MQDILTIVEKMVRVNKRTTARLKNQLLRRIVIVYTHIVCTFCKSQCTQKPYKTILSSFCALTEILQNVKRFHSLSTEND